MVPRDELASIVDRLSMIQQVFEHLVKAEEEERNRKRESEKIPLEVTGTFRLPEAIETKRSTDQERYHTTQKVIAVAAWAAFVAALLYAVVAQRQLGEMRSQTEQIFRQYQTDNADASLRAVQWLAQFKTAQREAKAAEDNVAEIRREFQEDQRPYVGITKTILIDPTTDSILPVPIKGKPLIINVFFKNIGKSPALNVRTHRHLLFGNSVSQIRGESPDKSKNGTILESGIENLMTAISVKDTYSIESVEIKSSDFASWDGSEPIIIFGRITYEDKFGTFYCRPYAQQLLTTGSWFNVSTIGGHDIGKMFCPTGKL
jgi:hypothetical protein